MKHLAYVEDDWFGRWLQDEPRPQALGLGGLGSRAGLGMGLCQLRRPRRSPHTWQERLLALALRPRVPSRQGSWLQDA